MQCGVVRREELPRATRAIQCVFTHPRTGCTYLQLCGAPRTRGHRKARREGASTRRCPFYPCDVPGCLFRELACIDPAKEELFSASFALMVKNVEVGDSCLESHRKPEHWVNDGTHSSDARN